MYGEETRKVRGYVEMYQEKAGIVSASGGTLSTRAAMSQGDAWVRKQMQNVFSLGGSVHGGTREEDRDMVLTKVFLDPLINKWVCPHQYAFFETRVVRRSHTRARRVCLLLRERRGVPKKRARKAPSNLGRKGGRELWHTHTRLQLAAQPARRRPG